MRVLVTGAAGFIGSQVAQLLLREGHRVTAVDNLCDAYDVRLKEHRLRALTQADNLEFVKADVGEREQMQSLWQAQGPFDAVINLAARAGVRPSVEDPWIYYSTNTVGTLNLLEMCREAGPSKFVLASTSRVGRGAGGRPKLSGGLRRRRPRNLGGHRQGPAGPRLGTPARTGGRHRPDGRVVP